MNSTNALPTLLNRLKVPATIAVVLAVFVGLVYWAGLPPASARPLFVAGVAVLIGCTFAFGGVVWHLLARPLPAGHAVPAAVGLSAAQRQLLAVLVGISGINIVVGAFWDEVWHRQYGVPLGEDLFWRPHLMLYFGFLLVMGLAGAGLFMLVKRGRGSWQQRFRAQPVVGLLVLVGGFLVYALPADPLWHLIYGEDISAWSLPHVILFLSFLFIIILAAAIQLSTMSEKKWSGLQRLSREEPFLYLVLSFVLLAGLQLLTTEWDTGTRYVMPNRPDWLLIALIGTAASFSGVLALRAIRRVGSATAIGLIALTIRMGLIAAFGYESISANAWIVSIPVLIGLDVAYALRLRLGRGAPPWLAAGTFAALGMTVGGLPLIARLFPQPQITQNNLLSMILAAQIACLLGAWAGQAAGDYLATANKQVEPQSAAAADRTARLIPMVSLAGVLIFIVLFVFTASPPF